MSRRLRILIGAMTTVLVCGVGALLLAEGRPMVGGVVLAFGLFRGAVWVRQVRAE